MSNSAKVGVEVERVRDLKDRRIRVEWNRVQKKILEDDQNFIPSMINPRRGRRGVESAFFILKKSSKPIGRATATIDRQWIERKNENTGFLDDLLIHSDYLADANELIDACVGFLKGKEVESVFARSSNFPAFRTNGFNSIPSFSLPNNPESSLTALTDFGFKELKKWKSQSFDILKSKSKHRQSQRFVDAKVKAEAQKYLHSVHASFTKLNFRKEFIAYSNLMDEVMLPIFGHTPIDTVQLRKQMGISSTALLKLFRFSNWVLRDEGEDEDKDKNKDNGGNVNVKLVGFFSFYPDLNLALKKLYHPSAKVPRIIRPFKMPATFLFELRRIKVAMIGGLGVSPSFRGKGITKNILDYGISLMKKAGFSQFNTGLMLTENIPVLKAASEVARRYKLIEEHNFSTFAYPMH